MGAMIGIEYLYVPTMAAIGILAERLYHWWDDKIYNPEGKVFKKGRKTGVPVYSTEDPGTGNGLFQLGHKDDDNDPVIEMEYGGCQIEPGFLSADAAPTRYPGGLNVYHCASTKSLPLPTRSALAYKTYKKHRRDKSTYRALDFISDSELAALLKSPRNHLDHNAAIYIEQYAPTLDGTPMTCDNMVEIVKDMQDYLAKLPVEQGWLCYHEMFKALPFSHSSQDTERIKVISEQKGWLKYMKRINIMQYAIMALMILVGGGVAIYMVAAAV